MLQIHHLTITHTRDLRPLLTDFSLTLHRGDKAVILGEEGDGKSTLLKWIYDPGLIADYTEAAGERILRGATLGYLPQELPAQDGALSAAAYFRASPAYAALRPDELQRLAALLHLPEDFHTARQRMDTFSGGEKVKLQLARVLMARPDVLLLDEPSNDVDGETLERLEELIVRHPGAVLFISHDEALIEATANRVILLEQLRHKTAARATVANMPFARFMAERSAGFEKQAQLARSQRREEQQALERFRRIRQKVENDQNSVSRADPHGGRLLKKKMASVKAMERRYERQHRELTDLPEYELPILIRFHDEQAVPAGKTVLELRLPRLCSPEGAVLASDVALTVRGPEKICITGPNGAGKTTLLRQIEALLRRRDGLHVFYMPQHYEDLLDPDMTPLDYLAPSGRKEEVTPARTYLGSLRYTAQEMARPIRALSGGQKAKLLLLKMSLSGANVLLLDEPTRNFSPLSGPEVRALLRSFPGVVISVSHDRKFLAEVCDKVYYLTPQGLQLL